MPKTGCAEKNALLPTACRFVVLNDKGKREDFTGHFANHDAAKLWYKNNQDFWSCRGYDLHLIDRRGNELPRD